MGLGRQAHETLFIFQEGNITHMLKKVDPVERVLLKRNAIPEEVLEKIKTNHSQQGKFLGKTLVENGYIHVDDLLKALSQELETPYLKFKDFPEKNLPIPDLEIPLAFLKEKTVFPLKLENNVLTLCVFNPFDFNTFEDLKLILGKTVQTILSSEEDIQEAIETFYGEGSSAINRIVDDIHEDDITDLDS